MSNFSCFLGGAPEAINLARQQHLAGLGLDLQNKRVLEIGAGIGLHTPFFLSRGCTVVVTDARLDNVEEARRRLPGVEVLQLDISNTSDISYLGRFDLVYCYGLLYHVGNPDQVLTRMASVCDDKILLETCVNTDVEKTLLTVNDSGGNNSSATGSGCRPSRAWVLDQLNQLWGHGYISRTQPSFHDFVLDWRNDTGMTRSIFVGSRQPLALSTLSTVPLQQQQRYEHKE
jgi:SAM-dependent methyltransferase